MQRQQVRRIVRKSAKRYTAKVQRQADADTLTAMRAARKPHQAVVQGPGKMLTSRRPFKKPRARPNWRVRNVKMQFGGGLVVRAEYHTTKGFRRWALAA